MNRGPRPAFLPVRCRIAGRGGVRILREAATGGIALGRLLVFSQCPALKSTRVPTIRF
jgi:hypothetical protein